MADISALVAGDAAAFEGLLQMLMSAQNEQRSVAEKAFAELKKHPDACASQLVRGLRTSPNLESRSLCAVLLRKARHSADHIHSNTPLTPPLSLSIRY
jgi:hypothetical protein